MSNNDETTTEFTPQPLHQYIYRLTGCEPWRITSNWYSCKTHANEAMKRLYGKHYIDGSARQVVETAALVPQWRTWGDARRQMVDVLVTDEEAL